MASEETGEEEIRESTKYSKIYRKFVISSFIRIGLLRPLSFASILIVIAIVGGDMGDFLDTFFLLKILITLIPAITLFGSTYYFLYASLGRNKIEDGEYIALESGLYVRIPMAIIIAELFLILGSQIFTQNTFDMLFYDLNTHLFFLLIVALSTFYNSALTYFAGKLEENKANNLRTIFLGVIAILEPSFYLIGRNLFSLMSAWFFSLIVSCVIILAYMSEKRKMFTFRPRVWWSLTTENLSIALSSPFFLLSQQIDTILLYLSPAVDGFVTLFYLGKRVTIIVSESCAALLGGLLSIFLSIDAERGEEYSNRIFQPALHLFSWFVLYLFLGVMLAIDVVLVIIQGISPTTYSTYVDAVPVVKIMSIYFWMGLTLRVIGERIDALEKSNTSASRYTIFATFIILATIVAYFVADSLIWFSLTLVFGMLIVLVFNFLYLEKYVKLAKRTILGMFILLLSIFFSVSIFLFFSYSLLLQWFTVAAIQCLALILLFISRFISGDEISFLKQMVKLMR